MDSNHYIPLNLGLGCAALLMAHGCESADVNLVQSDADLPECTDSIAGDIYFIVETGDRKRCEVGSWESVIPPASTRPTITEVATETDLPVCDSSSAGEEYFITTSKELRFCDGTEWISFVGPQGPTGADGATGPEGSAGTSYAAAVAALISKVESQAQAVLWIECTDGSTLWSGTGTKISNSSVISAHHVGDGAVACEFYSGATSVGSGFSYMTQLGGRDIVIFEDVDFNSTGESLPSVARKMGYGPSLGELMLLVSYPLDFIADRQFTAGLLTDTNVSAESLAELGGGSETYWANAIATDSAAAAGSSGAPVFNQDGEFVGIHVGGYSSLGLELNYQLLFDQ